MRWGSTSEPSERSWDSKDALLYALGVGAGALDPTGFELEFTTENSDGVTQRVLPDFTTIVGQGGGAGRSIGDYDPAMLVHGEQSIRLHGEIPAAGTVSITTKVAGMYDKGCGRPGRPRERVAARRQRRAWPSPTAPRSSSAAPAVSAARAIPRATRRARWPAEPLPTREPDEVVSYSTRTDQALLYRLSGDRNPLHSDPDVRQAGRLRPPDPPRALHLRLHRARPAARRLRLGPGALRRHARPLLQADDARRHADRLPVGHRRTSVPGSYRFRTETQRGETVIDAGLFSLGLSGSGRWRLSRGRPQHRPSTSRRWLCGSKPSADGQLVDGPATCRSKPALGVTSVTLPQLAHSRWWWCSVRSSASSKRANSSLAATRRTTPAL